MQDKESSLPEEELLDEMVGNDPSFEESLKLIEKIDELYRQIRD